MAGNYLSFNRLLSHLRRTEEQIDASSRPLSDDVRRDSTDGKTRSHQDHEGESRSTLWAQVVATVLQEDKVPQCVIQRINWKHGVAERERSYSAEDWVDYIRHMAPPVGLNSSSLQSTLSSLSLDRSSTRTTEKRCLMRAEWSHLTWKRMLIENFPIEHSFFFIQCERVVINTSKKLIL